MRIHTNNFPFRCETCGKGFLRNEGLVVHTRIHTGERPFQCVVCGKAYTRKDKLTRHAFVHTGERPHVCQHCGKSFIWKDKMQRHELIHKIEKPFTCVPCNLEFPRQENFNSHMERKHPDRLHYTLVQPPVHVSGSNSPYTLPQQHQLHSPDSPSPVGGVTQSDPTNLSMGHLQEHDAATMALSSKTLASITSRLPTSSFLSLQYS